MEDIIIEELGVETLSDFEETVSTGTFNYEKLNHKPKINGVELIGNKTTEELQIPVYDDTDIRKEINQVNDLAEQNEKDITNLDNRVVALDEEFKEQEKSLNHLDDIKADKTEIPKNVSQLNNDKGYISSIPSEYITESELESKNYAKKTDIPDVSEFITKSVNDLVNYYKKSETYTQTEINQLIGAIKTVSMKIVPERPQTGETNIIYLVPSKSATTENIYDEYIFANNKWELIGSTQVDLKNYYTIEQINQLLKNYVTSSNLTTILSTYAKKTDIPDMTNYLNKNDTVTNMLKGRIQIGDYTSTLNNAILHVRNVGATSITGKKVNGACYAVNSDGTAALQHKTYNDDGTGAKNEAVLRMSNNGLEFALNTGTGTTPTEDMYKKVATETDLEIRADVNLENITEIAEQKIKNIAGGGSDYTAGEYINIEDNTINVDRTGDITASLTTIDENINARNQLQAYLICKIPEGLEVNKIRVSAEFESKTHDKGTFSIGIWGANEPVIYNQGTELSATSNSKTILDDGTEVNVRSYSNYKSKVCNYYNDEFTYKYLLIQLKNYTYGGYVGIFDDIQKNIRIELNDKLVDIILTADNYYASSIGVFTKSNTSITTIDDVKREIDNAITGAIGGAY